MRSAVTFKREASFCTEDTASLEGDDLLELESIEMAEGGAPASEGVTALLERG